jgi:hypothetical protein
LLRSTCVVCLFPQAPRHRGLVSVFPKCSCFSRVRCCLRPGFLSVAFSATALRPQAIIYFLFLTCFLCFLVGLSARARKHATFCLVLVVAYSVYADTRDEICVLVLPPLAHPHGSDSLILLPMTCFSHLPLPFGHMFTIGFSLCPGSSVLVAPPKGQSRPTQAGAQFPTPGG